MFCHNCGHEVEPKAIVCIHLGHALTNTTLNIDGIMLLTGFINADANGLPLKD